MPGGESPPGSASPEANRTPTFAGLGLRTPAGWVPLPSEQPLPPPVVPDYTVLRRIGGGAYGEVWLARNFTGSHFALKVVHRRLFDHDRPFERELAGIRRFEPVSRSHPSQVAIHHVGQNAAEGYFYYVMDLADDAGPAGTGPLPEPATPVSPPGQPASETRDPNSETRTPNSDPLDPDRYVPKTLKHVLRTRGRLPLAECLDIGRALATALEHLHGHGLVHRDVKPSNVIFAGGVPKLADIGLVTSIDATRSFVGTEGFYPPEGPGTAPADLFSLGKLLYEIASGKDRREFPELPTDLASAEEQERLSELNAVILKACQPDPARRYPTATALRADLERLQRGHSVKRQRAWQRRWGRVRKIAVPAALGVVALFAVLVAIKPHSGADLAPLNGQGASRTNGSPTAVAGLDPRAIFVLPIRAAATHGAPGDLCSRITDAFIDSLGLLTNQGVVVGPRKSGWGHLPVAAQIDRVTNGFSRMRFALTGVAALITNAASSQVGRDSVEPTPPPNPPGSLPASGDGASVELSRSAPAPFQLDLTLHDLLTGTPRWTETFQGTTNEIIALEQRAVARVADSLGGQLTAAHTRRIATLLTNNLEALGWLRQAVSAYADGGSTQEACNRALGFTRESLRLDPHYVDADFYDVYMLRVLSLERNPVETWPQVARRDDAILRVDDTHAMALDQRAGYALVYKRDWDAFDAYYARCFPALPDDLRHGYWGFYLRICGRFDEARKEEAKFEDPEPLGVDWQFFIVSSRWADKKYADGIRAARRALELYPQNMDGYLYLAHCQVAKGDYAEGIVTLQKARAVYRKQELTGLLAVAYAGLGETNKARAVLQELLQIEHSPLYLQPYIVARVYVALGDTNSALDWLERAAQEGCEFLFYPDWGGLRSDYIWDSLQDDPRYWKICDAAGLGKDQWPRKHVLLPP